MTRPKLPSASIGDGGELHQTNDERPLTTNQGLPVADDQNSLKVGPRGPTLLEDFHLREKITHFDHERIPERIVHARGSGAHGYFVTEVSMRPFTRAQFLQEVGTRTPVFARFSTVAGGAGSVDTPRDVRGFAVKFYTQEGNFDLVGNDIPVFFIQDAIKFPDLVHAVKMEPDRGFPQAASAHDTFWDFVSLMPESTHMLMWAMSDRTLPRSFRTMEGFGVHTFRLVDLNGKSTFVKFHWRPKLGLQSTLWDEAVKIQGADNDYHRRDLWKAIDSGNFPEWELKLQLFTEEQANGFDFDVLDATKLIPEELVPLTHVGRLVLDKNPDNFFAETEQIAFCPANIVPGVDFTNDPLLQGRLFSYLDTQLLRLGGPNFHQIPINAPKCPFQNFQRDGFMQMQRPPGRINYEPNSLGPSTERESHARGFVTSHRSESGSLLRVRPESFADHYSHARLFWISQTEPEQNHIVAAYVFELSKVSTVAIRERMVANLGNVDAQLAARVAKGLGMAKVPAPSATKVPTKTDAAPSPMLSILAKTTPSLAGRVIGCLITDGSSAKLLAEVQAAAAAVQASVEVIAPTIGGTVLDDGTVIEVHHHLPGAPSVLFDTVVVMPGDDAVAELLLDSAARDFVTNAFVHLKIIGYAPAAQPLMAVSGVGTAKYDQGVVVLTDAQGVSTYVAQASTLRIWDREPKVRKVF